MDRVVAFGGSLVAGAVAWVAPVETLVAAAAVLALVGAGRRPGAAIFLALAVLAGLGLGAWRASRLVQGHEAARDAAARAIGPPARCTARARVVSAPVQVTRTDGPALRWDADLDDLDCDEKDGIVGIAWRGRATLYGGPSDLARGDDVEVVANLAPPQRLWNEATGDPRPGEARRGVVRSGAAVHVRIHRRGVGLFAWIDRARAHVRERIEATFPSDAAPMARAIVLGESDLAAADEAAFRGSGLAHLLAVSGMHLVIVVLGATAALRALLVRIESVAARMDAGRLAAAVGIPFAWVYAELAGGSGSTLRAAWMMTAQLLARAIGRRTDGPRAFGLSLLAMAVADPLVAFDVSFLLSAAATAGLLAWAKPLSDLLASKLPGVLAPLARSVGTTLAATIPCAPILARFAPALPLGSVVANLLAVPIGELVALPLCLAHALLAPLPVVEAGCAVLASGALVAVRAVARVFAGVAALSVELPPPTALQLAALAVAFAALVLRRGLARGASVAVAAAVLLVAELRVRSVEAPHGVLRATFLDVGQGDAAIVDLPSGEALVIDGGGLVGSPIDVGDRVLAPALRWRRRRSVHAAILSHPHPDHFIGLASGLRAVRVGALWDTGQGERESVGGAYRSLLADLASRGTRVLRPDALCGPHAIGGATIEVLSPCPGPLVDRGPNDNSFVLRIAYGSRAFLFVGDAEREEEAELVAKYGSRLRADVLKVGHHGSRTSSTAPFLAAVAPRDAVISSGVRNRFGHPHPTTLAALASAASRVWRTDRDGAVTATTDGVSVDVHAIGR